MVDFDNNEDDTDLGNDVYVPEGDHEDHKAIPKMVALGTVLGTIRTTLGHTSANARGDVPVRI